MEQQKQEVLMQSEVWPEYPILEYPHAALKKPCKKVESFLGVDNAVAIMKQALSKEQGLGLAANQLGFEYRVFIMSESMGKELGDKTVFVNPVITSKSDNMVEESEGCLSFPNVFLKVKRHATISITAQDENGKEFFIDEMTGMPAVVFQHELDHLDGKTFLDYLSRLKRDVAERKIRKWQKQQKIAEKKIGEIQKAMGKRNPLYRQK